ncbi:MAG TPA: class I SAM-dependent methyltransferase [Gemmataceae bacterium]|nr:class I SAM-dependent methyltransferase [Gemmataceae bacterium]
MKLIDRLLQRWRISKARAYVRPGARVLDIGCADGELFRRIPEVAEGVGVDPDLPESINPCPQTLFVKGLFPSALPDKRPFDVITMLAVLEHVPPDRQKTLAVDCGRHLKPGGYLIITVPAPAVDHILGLLRAVRLIDGMTLEQHYGYVPQNTPDIFAAGDLELVEHRRFQLGLNNLFVFKKATRAAEDLPFAEIKSSPALAFASH